METPDVGQQAGSDAKGDHVRQRIQLLAEFAGGVCHARDAPVEGVERNGKKNGDGRPVQVEARIAVRSDGGDGLGDGEVARGDVANREQRRQQVHAATETRLGPGAVDGRVVSGHQRPPPREPAPAVAPAVAVASRCRLSGGFRHHGQNRSPRL